MKNLEALERMSTFCLHWRDGTTQVIHGKDIVSAINAIGYGTGALKALDYWEQMKEPTKYEAQPDS